MVYEVGDGTIAQAASNATYLRYEVAPIMDILDDLQRMYRATQNELYAKTARYYTLVLGRSINTIVMLQCPYHDDIHPYINAALSYNPLISGTPVSVRAIMNEVSRKLGPNEAHIVGVACACFGVYWNMGLCSSMQIMYLHLEMMLIMRV